MCFILEKIHTVRVYKLVESPVTCLYGTKRFNYPMLQAHERFYDCVLSKDNFSNMSHSPSQTSLSSLDAPSMQRKKSKERKDSKSSSSGNNKKGGAKRKLTKDDIGKPENFQ